MFQVPSSTAGVGLLGGGGGAHPLSSGQMGCRRGAIFVIKPKRHNKIHIIVMICHSNLSSLKCSNLKYSNIILLLYFEGGRGDTHD